MHSRPPSRVPDGLQRTGAAVHRLTGNVWHLGRAYCSAGSVPELTANRRCADSFGIGENEPDDRSEQLEHKKNLFWILNRQLEVKGVRKPRVWEYSEELC